MSVLAPAQPELLTPTDTIQALATMLDPLAEIGNREVVPKVIELGINNLGIRISTMPQRHEVAISSFIFVDCYDDVQKQGRVYLQGDLQNPKTTARDWRLITKPFSTEPVSAETLDLTKTYIGPFSDWWEGLGSEGQSRAFAATKAEHIRDIQSRPKRITKMLSWLASTS